MISRKLADPKHACKSCHTVSRNAGWLDSLAIEAVIDRLSRDDAIEPVRPAERAITSISYGSRRAARCWTSP